MSHDCGYTKILYIFLKDVKKGGTDRIGES